MERTVKIRRSGAYGIAAGLVLLGSMFLPMSTPRWYGMVFLSVVCVLAGCALYFSARERRGGEAGRSVGFFTFAVLVILLGLLTVLTMVL